MEYDLGSRGLRVVSGRNEDDTGADSNGAGKSALVMAALWCLTGRSDARTLVGSPTSRECCVFRVWPAGCSCRICPLELVTFPACLLIRQVCVQSAQLSEQEVLIFEASCILEDNFLNSELRRRAMGARPSDLLAGSQALRSAGDSHV